MAKRRKVGNLLALAVLSTLVQRPMHPYEIVGVLRERGKDTVKIGSLYTVVGNLEKHGFLETIGSVRRGGRPERTVYRITEAGRAEMVDWVRELVATPESEQLRFAAGLSVLAALPPDEVAPLLRRRLAVLAERLDEQRAALERDSQEIPRLFLLENEYDLALREAEMGWIRGVLDELTSGSFPGLAQWRAFHQTGQRSPELAERGSPGE